LSRDQNGVRAASTKRKNAAIFTIVSANYIAFAATLMQSLREHHPDIPRFIILSDAYRTFPGIDLAAEVIACDDLGIELLDNMKLWYSIVEFNTAIKPFVFSYLMAQRGFTSAVYLDPDIAVFAPLDEVFNALRRHSLVLTPHMMKPLQDGKQPSDHTILKSGVYNLGFLALKQDEDTENLVQWWCDRLFLHCRIDLPGHMFTDQRWMDLAPAFVERTFILRHPGYNVAYWNVAHRVVDRNAAGDWTVDGKPLKFFHFSGTKPDDEPVFSKHQDRFGPDNLGCIGELCSSYRAAVLANRWREFSRMTYAYGRFSDGRAISDTMRRWVLRAVDEGRLPAKECLKLGSGYFDAVDEQEFPGGNRLTRFAYQYWLDRVDLQRAFDLARPDGVNLYLDWFCGSGAEGDGVDPLDIQALRQLRGVERNEGPVLPTAPVRIPWPSVASSFWRGAAASVGDWMREEISFDIGSHTVILPRQLALLWERRSDLQSHFPLHDDPQQFDAFVAWALSDGLLEKALQPDCFTGRMLETLTALSHMSVYYGDVPITRALILTRHIDRGREGLASWRRFPVEKAARAQHGFWFSYVAPGLFGWPPALYATVRAYFDTPSLLSVDGYRFTRGMLTLWEMRGDLQQAFHLDTVESKWRFLYWLIRCAPGETGAAVEALCPDIADFLAGESSRVPGISRLLEFVHDSRPDLQDAFDLSTATGPASLRAWSVVHLRQHLQDTRLTALSPEHFADTADELPKTVRARVALTGHWEVASGIGEDLRSSAAALDACGFVDYVIVNLDSENLLTSAKRKLPAGTRLDVEWNIVHRNAETSVEDWQWLQLLGVSARRVVGHWAWELERLPSRWRHCFSFYDEIWAASKFALKAFAAERCRPVRLLPQAVTVPAIPHAVSRAQLGLADAATVFLFMFDFTSYAARKNPEAVIRAFAQAFPEGNEPVQLMIKTQNAAKMPAHWSPLAALGGDKRVIIRDDRLTREELVGLIRSADAFVSLHRSEGYGRGPAEAMLLGRPVILTGYSGTNDFVDRDSACMVEYSLVPVQPNAYPGVEGQRWAEPEVADAARYMRWVHEHPEAARAMGHRARLKISTMLAPERIGRGMIALMQTAAGDTAAPGLANVA
jgi:glycosyltransferase involved in cell wall biosynthesis